MFRSERGFLNKLWDQLPISRVEARRQAHNDLIRSARIQATRGIMLSMVNSLTQRQSPLRDPEKAWWKAQTVRWEMIWAMVNEASLNITDFRQISKLCQISNTAFRLYEQMVVDSMTALHGVPRDTMYEEALRWRETGTLIASLYRHCLMERLNEVPPPPEGKNPEESGIITMKG